IPRERSSAQREEPRSEAAQRNETQSEPTDGQHPERGSPHAEASHGDTATRDEDPNGDVANGNPPDGHPAAIDPVGEAARRDVDEGQAEEASIGSKFHRPYGPATGWTRVTKYSVSPKQLVGSPLCCS